MSDDHDTKKLVHELDALMTKQVANNRYLARVHDYLARGVRQLPLFRLGLTGGFSTGKSTVAQIFEELGCPIVSADAIVHDLLAHDTTTINDVRYAFGDEVLCHPESACHPEAPQSGAEGSNPQINRHALATRIFANPEERKALEAILHPRVGDEMKREAARLEADGHTIACFEIPLLYEAGWEGWCDSVIVVACDEAEQIDRAMLKLGITREDALARIRAQKPLEEKKKRADSVLDTTGPLESLKPQVEAIYIRLLPQT